MREKKIFVVTANSVDYLEFVSDFMLDKNVWRFCNSPKSLYGYMNYDLFAIGGWQNIDPEVYKKIFDQYKIFGRRCIPEPPPPIADKISSSFAEWVKKLCADSIKEAVQEVLEEECSKTGNTHSVTKDFDDHKGDVKPQESREIKPDRKAAGPVVVDLQCEMPVSYLKEILMDRYNTGFIIAKNGSPVNDDDVMEQVKNFKIKIVAVAGKV